MAEESTPVCKARTAVRKTAAPFFCRVRSATTELHAETVEEDQLDLTIIVGGLAAAFSTVSFAPQAFKMIRSRDTSGISTGTYALTVAGFILWSTYGILLGAWPLIVSNTICLALSAFILTMKIRSHTQ